MGSEPNWLVRRLQSNPDSIFWSDPRQVKIVRGQSGKLGLRFQTVQCFSRGLSNTVVLRVRNTCIIESGKLFNYDRINKINGISLTNRNEDEVDALFLDKQQTVFLLEVQSELLHKYDQVSDCPTVNSCQTYTSSEYSASLQGEQNIMMNQSSKTKRLLSNTGSSGKASLSSVERPSASAPNKRFVKSSSTETEESGGQDQLSPAAMMQHPLAPSVNGYLQGTHSMTDPVPIEGIGIEIEDNQRVHSLPACLNRPAGKCHGCDNGVGPAKTHNPGHLNIHVCHNQRCKGLKDGCDWHALIFRVPQFVVWDTSLEKIDLQKGNSSTFGITKKVKIQEATGEMYTLVESVAQGSVAEKKGIRVGDWIRSVNGQALQSRNEAHHTKFDQYKEIHLVSQRPVAILEKARQHMMRNRPPMMRLKMPDKMNIPAVYSPSSPAVHSPYDVSPSSQTWSPNPGVSPVRSAQRQEEYIITGPRRAVDRMSEQNYVAATNRVVDPRLSPAMNPQANDLHSVKRGLTHGGLSPDSGRCPCRKEINLPGPDEFIAQLSPEDNTSPVFNSMSSSPRSPREGHVPSMKVFLCGNSAAELGEMILSRSRTGQRVARDSNVQHFKFSLRRELNSDIFMDFWQNGQHNHVMNGNGYFNTSTTSSCNQCLINSESNSVVNVELFVIQDENFFHHCSPFMFVENSIFLIAFNAQKILTNMSTDIARLEHIIHTIRSHLGITAAVELYGLLTVDPGEEDMDYQVRTMFYANDKKDGKYSVPIPRINFITRLSCAEAISDLCATLFKRKMSQVQKQSSVIELISAGLSKLEQETRTVWTREEVQQLVAEFAQNRDLVLHSDLVQILENIGSLKGITNKVSLFQDGTTGQDYFVHPHSVHNRLVSLCFDQRDVDSDIMLRLASSGMLPRADLMSFLRNVVVDTELFIRCLQMLNVVYDMGSADKTKARQEQVFLFPYFLEDLPFDKDLPAPDDVCLYAVFSSAVPWTVFYKLTSALACQDECLKVKFTKKRFCEVMLKQVCLKLLFDKMNDQIIITIDRGSNSGRENMVYQLLKQVLAITVPASHQYQLGITCPLSNSHTHNPGHVINLTTDCPITCGTISLDSNVKVRKWTIANKQMSVEEYMSQNVLKLPPGVFQEICNRLIVPQHNDWKALADLCGKTTEDVTILESIGHSTNKLPSQLFLIDWDHKKQGTVRQLYDNLVKLERTDVTKIIDEYLRTCEAIRDFKE